MSGIFSFPIPSEGRITLQVSLDKCGVYEISNPYFPLFNSPHILLAFQTRQNASLSYLTLCRDVKEKGGGDFLTPFFWA